MEGAIHWQRLAYRAAWSAGTPLALAAAVLHPHVRSSVMHRLGGLPDVAAGGIWIHAASAGDIVAITPVVDALRRRRLPCLVTASTRAGRAMAAERLPGVPHAALPLDHPWTIRRALARVRPRLLLLEARELWPELLHAAAANGTRVAVVNARLSERSANAYARWSGLMAEALRVPEIWCAADAGNARRLEWAGVPADRIAVTGNTKLDAAARAALAGENPGARRGEPASHRRIVFASVHAGAEARSVLAVCDALARRFSDVRLDLVLRYPRDRGAVERMARAVDAPIRLWHRMGDLAQRYPAATAAFVGGSLCRRGGHSVVEPAAAGVPFVIGPHHGNAAGALAVLAGAGARTAVDTDALLSILTRWLADPTRARREGEALRRRLLGAQGATKRTLVELEALL